MGGGTLLQVLGCSNWCESSKLLFHLVWGRGNYQKYEVVTCVKVICKKISWEQLVEGGGRMPRLFLYWYESSILNYALAQCYNLILNEATLS